MMRIWECHFSLIIFSLSLFLSHFRLVFYSFGDISLALLNAFSPHAQKNLVETCKMTKRTFYFLHESLPLFGLTFSFALLHALRKKTTNVRICKQIWLWNTTSSTSWIPNSENSRIRLTNEQPKKKNYEM